MQQQKQKKIPVRRCVGCNAQRPKRELVRVVRSPEGEISIDLRGKAPGRGAYLCPSAACLAKARKAKRLERTFEVPIPGEIYDRLTEEIQCAEQSAKENTRSSVQHPLLGALGLCRKAGKLLHGYDRVQENALRGKVALVLLAADASERTVTHMRSACEGIVACEQMPLTTADLAMLTPKPAAVFGITDEHLAQLCAKHLT